MSAKFDVIVVGAGPSGTSCAYNLKRFNPSLNILLIDKATFPRYKPCGGGISPDVFNYFDFDLSEVIDHHEKTSDMVFKGRRIRSEAGEVLMVRREVFDHFLLKKCIEKGVETHLGHKVLAVETDKTSVLVKTAEQKFSGKVVVLAEGGRGQLAKKLGIAAKNTIVAGLEYEHYTDTVTDHLEINLDQGDTFYAWNFPKSNGLSLGVGASVKGRTKKGIPLPAELKKYVKQFQVEKLAKQHLHGHPIELYSGRQQLVHNRVVLIGEIAGCVDPLTAEGIRPAIKSGYLAAKVLDDVMESGQIRHLKQYNKAFHEAIGKDFRYARFLSYCIQKNRAFFLARLHSERAVAAFMRVFSGHANYRDYISKKRILRLLKGIF